jgi:hypothetical protein
MRRSAATNEFGNRVNTASSRYIEDSTSTSALQPEAAARRIHNGNTFVAQLKTAVLEKDNLAQSQIHESDNELPARI